MGSVNVNYSYAVTFPRDIVFFGLRSALLRPMVTDLKNILLPQFLLVASFIKLLPYKKSGELRQYFHGIMPQSQLLGRARYLCKNILDSIVQYQEGF